MVTVEHLITCSIKLWSWSAYSLWEASQCVIFIFITLKFFDLAGLLERRFLPTQSLFMFRISINTTACPSLLVNTIIYSFSSIFFPGLQSMVSVWTVNPGGNHNKITQLYKNNICKKFWECLWNLVRIFQKIETILQEPNIVNHHLVINA